MAAARDVVAEAGAGNDLNRRVYESWSDFREKIVALAPLTELGYMTIRQG